MTLVNIDLQNAGYETGPDDRVVFYSPANRNEQGAIISTAEVSVPLVDGQASKELTPGPVVVHILAQGVADTRPKSGYVPEEGPVSLWDVILDWTPALVDQGILAILAAMEGALDRVIDSAEEALSDYFSPPSENLFNPADIESGWALLAGSGTPVVDPNYGLTSPIPVQAGLRYSWTGIARVSFFTDDDTFISSRDGSTLGIPITHTAPGDPVAATYMRLSVYLPYLGEAQINQGDTLLPYEPYSPGGVSPDRLPKKLWFDIGPEDIGAQPEGDYLEGPIAPDDTTFFDVPTNLFIISTVTAGQVILGGAATPVENPEHSVSAPIPVTGGETYSYRGANRLTYLTSSGAYAGHDDPTTAEREGTITIPESATHVRLSIITQRVDLGTVQLNAGPMLLPYEPGQPKISDRFLPTSQAGGGEVDISTVLPRIIDAPGLEEVYTAPTVPGRTDLEAVRPADVIGWWETLRTAHPDYVTRRQIGTASDGATPLWAYTLRPPEVPSHVHGTVLPELVQPLPAGMIITGAHGSEKAGPWITHHFAKELCERWDESPALEAIRWNFEMVFIPLLNPHGWEEGGSFRYNANGVDLARNFPAGWSSGGSQPTGPHPLSEPESAAADALMAEIADRCVFGTSFHNFNGNAERPWLMMWQSASTPLMLALGKKIVTRMSRKWRAEHEVVSTEPYFGYADLSLPPGTEGRAFVAHGIPGSTFETCQDALLLGPGDRWDSRSMTLGLESFVNYVALSLAEGVRLKPGIQ